MSDWATYRDRPTCRGAATYYNAHRHLAAVSLDVFRTRVRRGMDLREALTTPKVKSWGGTRGAVLAAIIRTPGIERAELNDLNEQGAAISCAIQRLLRAGVIRRETVPYVDKYRVKRKRYHYYYVPEQMVVPYTAPPVVLTEQTLERLWEPKPWCNPIRARALGLPVADTPRTREVREALAYRPAKAA